MEIGFVLIKILPRYEFHVYKKLKKLNEVVYAFPLYGEYDFIVKIKMNNLENIGKIVFDKIRTIEGVKKTETLSGTKL